MEISLIELNIIYEQLDVLLILKSIFCYQIYGKTRDRPWAESEPGRPGSETQRIIYSRVAAGT